MTFTNNKAIYLQIADRLCTEILMGQYAEGARVPSVREYAVLLEVNTNTAVKSYETLAAAGIIYKNRGLGYFVAQGAKERIMTDRRREFMEQILPELFRGMGLLGIGIGEVDNAYIQYQNGAQETAPGHDSEA